MLAAASLLGTLDSTQDWGVAILLKVTDQNGDKEDSGELALKSTVCWSPVLFQTDGKGSYLKYSNEEWYQYCPVDIAVEKDDDDDY